MNLRRTARRLGGIAGHLIARLRRSTERRAARARIVGPTTSFRDELLAENLVSTMNSVLQEEEFRHVIMPISDAGTARSFFDLRRAILKFVQENAEAVSAATRADRRRWFAALLAASTVIFLDVAASVSVCFILILTLVRPSQMIHRWAAADVVDRWIAVLATIAAFAVAGWATRRTLRWVTESWVDREVATADEVRPLVRVAINEFTNRVHATRLLVENAPGLAEASDPDQLVFRRQFRRLAVLTERLGANTIAISGPRGAGKTTLLRQIGALHDDDRGEASLRLVVAAPVTYDPRDFLIHLYLRLCSAVLARTGKSREVRTWIRFLVMAVRNGIKLAILVVFLVLLAPAAIPGAELFLRETGAPLPRSTLASGLACIGLGGLFVLASRLRVSGQQTASIHIASRADTERRRLSFLRTVTSERSGTVSRWGLQVGGRAANQLAEQPVSLPELVDSYREFSYEVTRWLQRQGGRGTRLIVGIDEVDRIADPQEAERFLNSIKPIFGVRGCIYVVTVSEEALALFEQRLVRARTAMDSAFDEVIRLDRFVFKESVELLRRRVIGFPDAFVMLAHCLSGGVPRDLVRAARTILELRIDSKKSTLDDLVPIVLRWEMETLKRGLVDQVSGIRFAGVGDELMALLGDSAWPPTPSEPTWWWTRSSPLFTATTRLADLLGGNRELAAIGQELASAVYFYATVYDLFVGHRSASNGMWPAPVAARSRQMPLRAAVDQLAVIRGTLAVGADLSRRRLDNLRSAVGLPVPTIQK